MDARAGTPAQPSDLIDVDQVVGAYYDLSPDPEDPGQQVAFGTSGHRGSSLDHAFNEAHIVAITAAIVEYRRGQGTDGPLFIGRDTHALSRPAWQTALEVLAAAGVDVMIDARDSWTPTPAVSQSILLHNQTRFIEGTPGRAAPGAGLADGIVVTPSHNPPRDGGFKYNPPHGGPADSDATGWIADRANEILRTGVGHVKRVSLDAALASDTTHRHDFLSTYVDDLANVLDLEAIRTSGVRIGADPLGGASVEYWGEIADRYDLDLTVVNPQVDPRWAFMTLDWDGKIRMDCSSPYAMASLVERMTSGADPVGGAPFDIATGNDADSDRHGIVTADGLMNPNHFLAVAIEYLYGGARPSWPSGAAIGKTLVSSALIDRVAGDLNRRLLEVPVGFKWFVPGLLSGEVGFGGEESAGASFLRKDGRVWSTDKDGILLALLASEILATTGTSPSAHHAAQVERFGESWYARVDAAATREQKARLGALSPSDVTSTTLAGQDITAKLTEAPGNGAKVGGLKVTTADAWFAARPSGTEDVYKIYAESFVSAEHLTEVQEAARTLVDEALA
ncbi:phosphoglucomutase (alpha-D-glucose-1,6-bisphosphate-dependent) [Promicromonospora iranensis]|uniref:Phosphoglucomutase n=1 Tax=Promicromonospora iranensis TaxID=1105144 RepID=A0ABU2CQ34_9MICO|nr:phosphoglucomutase (alpha-D-glucose-1,6-bisphosphate-dependent) [Promicromonospora iranensis]MDR7383459.1 phosphoglucomutase [Promicromonospora iranensis]